MISLDHLRKADAEISQLTDDELTEVRQNLYDLGELIFDEWKKEKFNYKNNKKSFPIKADEITM